MWSSLLYAGRLAQRLEKDELYAQNRSKNEWEEAAARYEGSGFTVKQHAVRRLGRTAIK